MIKQLLFIGGSKGIGKTSLAKAISRRLQFEYINTGEKFRKYRPEFDNKLVEELINLEKNFVIDTHYATSSRKTPYNFHIGLNEDSQKKLREKSLYSGKIIIIKAKPETILIRRLKDGEERRCLELHQIIKENEYNELYAKIYSFYLNLPYVEFNNEQLSLDKSINNLLEAIKK